MWAATLPWGNYLDNTIIVGLRRESNVYFILRKVKIDFGACLSYTVYLQAQNADEHSENGFDVQIQKDILKRNIKCAPSIIYIHDSNYKSFCSFPPSHKFFNLYLSLY